MDRDHDEVAEPVESSRRFSPWFWVILATLPVFYALSVGPVLAYAKEPVNSKFINVFYAPLIWLDAHTPLKGPIEWYVGLWVNNGH